MLEGKGMTDIDEQLAANPPATETAVSIVRSARWCRRHAWVFLEQAMADGSTWECDRCGTQRDEVRSRRGKSNRRLGSDQERRAERLYGWEKIGERGEKTDLRGRMFKTQQKSTRRAVPALFRDTFAGLAASRDGRIPLLLLSYVQAGIGTDDYIVIRGSDWLDLHGRDEEEA